MITGLEALKRMGFTDEEATQLDAIATQLARAGLPYRPEVLGQMCLPVIMGRGPIVPMNALDMTIKAADVRKRIAELIMGQATYSSTDNGDGTYTHTYDFD